MKVFWFFFSKKNRLLDHTLIAIEGCYAAILSIPALHALMTL
jgi:hypothetical protein